MAERPLRNRQPNAIDEDVIAQRVMDKLVANDDYVAKISSKICEQISRLLDENIKGLAEEVSQLRTNIKQIVNNLRIFGVQETPNEDTYQTFIDLYKNKLQVDIQSYDIDTIHRLRAKENGITPIIVRFTRRMVKKKIFNSKRKLKGTKIVIKEDLTPHRLSLLKRLSSTAPAKSYWTSNGRVFYKSGETIRHIKSLSDIV